MYRINREESFFFRMIKEWSESNKPNLVNTSPYVMHLICQKDPSFIVNAKGRAITLELLETTLNLVDDKEAVEIKELEGEKSIVFEVKVAEKDMGKIIGKQGRLAKSIRTVVKAVASKEQKRVSIEFIG